MSFNIYLDSKKVEKLEGFEEIERHDRGRKWFNYLLPGISISREKGRYYVVLHEVGDSIPELVKDIVEEISFYDSIPACPTRMRGVYVYQDATATVDKRDSQDYYEVRIRGKKMESVCELYRLIRAGKIKPKESWEEKQAKKGIVPLVLRLFR